MQLRILQQLAEHAGRHPAMDDFAPTEHHTHMRLPSFVAVDDLADNPSRSAVESTRRAVKRLADEGLVELRYASRKRTARGRWDSHYQQYVTVDAEHLCARLPLEGETATAWAAEMQRREDIRLDGAKAAMAMFRALIA